MSLELHDIGFGYGNETGAGGVRHINLQVADSELLAVMGPSGCGKSTLLKLCAGLLAPTQGRITLDGKDITHLPPHRRRMGVVFQGYALFPHMTVADNVGYGLRVRGEKGLALEVKVNEMLALVGLSAFARQRPAQLSGGQQQRVALARALCFKPRALLLDEPLSALDASLRGPLRDEIKRLQRLASATAIFVTHDPPSAAMRHATGGLRTTSQRRGRTPDRSVHRAARTGASRRLRACARGRYTSVASGLQDKRLCGGRHGAGDGAARACAGQPTPGHAQPL